MHDKVLSSYLFICSFLFLTVILLYVIVIHKHEWNVIFISWDRAQSLRLSVNNNDILWMLVIGLCPTAFDHSDFLLRILFLLITLTQYCKVFYRSVQWLLSYCIITHGYSFIYKAKGTVHQYRSHSSTSKYYIIVMFYA